MQEKDCVICYEFIGTLIATKCCGQQVHQECLDKWLQRSCRCMFCREWLSEDSSGSESDLEWSWYDPDTEMSDLWIDPMGYIDVDLATSSATVTNERDTRPSPNVYIKEHHEIEGLDDDYFMNNTVIILHNGTYLSSIGVPVGWIVRINGSVVRIQVSRLYMRVND